MTRNLIVQRHSPDWPHFDLEESRHFLRGAGIDETVVIDFVAIWDRAFRLGYREVRQEMKQISIANYHAVKSAEVIDYERLRSVDLVDDDLVVFVDDDDWLRADLFAGIRAVGFSDHGAKWGSLRIGRLERPLPFDTDAAFIARRPISDVVFTNNYAVTGKLLQAIGPRPVLEHVSAWAGLNMGKFQPRTISEYLSAANKHPCCTLAARAALQSEEFRTNPVAYLDQFVSDLALAQPRPEDSWITPLKDSILKVFTAALHGPKGTVRV